MSPRIEALYVTFSAMFTTNPKNSCLIKQFYGSSEECVVDI